MSNEINTSINSSGYEEKVFLADDDNLDGVTAYIESKFEDYNVSPKVLMQLAVAIEEIFVNIAHYAYSPDKGDAIVGTKFDANTGILGIRFRDKGHPFNPLAKEDPDITLGAEERGIGGLGIFMVKKIMDDVKYEYVNGENILELTKKL